MTNRPTTPRRGSGVFVRSTIQSGNRLIQAISFFPKLRYYDSYIHLNFLRVSSEVTAEYDLGVHHLTVTTRSKYRNE